MRSVGLCRIRQTLGSKVLSLANLKITGISVGGLTGTGQRGDRNVSFLCKII